MKGHEESVGKLKMNSFGREINTASRSWAGNLAEENKDHERKGEMVEVAIAPNLATQRIVSSYTAMEPLYCTSYEMNKEVWVL
jgi:hypothetical protein